MNKKTKSCRNQEWRVVHVIVWANEYSKQKTNQEFQNISTSIKKKFSIEFFWNTRKQECQLKSYANYACIVFYTNVLEQDTDVCPYYVSRNFENGTRLCELF